MTGKLSIVATPIGNLGDMTIRAQEVLAHADCICAEDTRVTGQLLKAFDIHTKLQRCDENVIIQKTPALIKRIKAGEHIAFCSDAGMPGISDPGMVLIDAARNEEIEVEVLPGASAVITALISAGFGGTAFYFGGFLPRKTKQRLEELKKLEALDAALVFYESPHRIIDTLKDIASLFPNRTIAMCRELTKIHEEVLRLPADKLLQNLNKRDSIKGEIVLVLAPCSPESKELNLEDTFVQNFIQEQLASGISKSQLAKKLAAEFGFSKNKAYNYLLTL